MSGSPQLAEMLDRRLVTPAQWRAGNQFRGDWQLSQATTGRDSLERARGMSGEAWAENVSSARRRVDLARSWLGIDLTRLVVEVAVRDATPAEAARAMGQDSRWGAPTLRVALERLTQVYQERDEPTLRVSA